MFKRDLHRKLIIKVFYFGWFLHLNLEWGHDNFSLQFRNSWNLYSNNLSHILWVRCNRNARTSFFFFWWLFSQHFQQSFTISLPLSWQWIQRDCVMGVRSVRFTRSWELNHKSWRYVQLVLHWTIVFPDNPKHIDAFSPPWYMFKNSHSWNWAPARMKCMY